MKPGREGRLAFNEEHVINLFGQLEFYTIGELCKPTLNTSFYFPSREGESMPTPFRHCLRALGKGMNP